mmetsp:Transcript_30811/g.67644  ORF Transcript_30811/g.67644 Transcript_30811/m.67644 type:complete len:363 (-) Transcript_30811:74-1162(-)
MSKLPSKMKAIVATGFGDIDSNVHLDDDFPTPTLPAKDDGKHMIIRVLACALAPGDVRVLSGKTDYMQMPECGFPYVIGSDVSGIVVAVGPEETKFSPGDYVVSRFDEPKPNGGAAEYRLVKTCLSEKCPKSISPIMACGLPASAMAAKRIVQQCMKKGDKVLIIGGSGAVGTSCIQYAKLYGASSIVAVSTQGGLCKGLGADRVIDYRKEKWWQIKDFQGKGNQFDIAFDFVNGDNWRKGARTGAAIKRKGKYVALMTGVDTEFEAHGVWDAVKLMCGIVFGNILLSRLHPMLPKWIGPEALRLEDGDLKALFSDVEEGRLKPIIEPSSPFEFTAGGARDALRLQKSKHAHGKVVIQIAKE